MGHARVKTWPQADEILQMEIRWQIDKLHRSPGKSPPACARRPFSQTTPCPPSALLDLHFSLRTSRQVKHDCSIDFEGLNYEISPRKRKFVTILTRNSGCSNSLQKTFGLLSSALSPSKYLSPFAPVRNPFLLRRRHHSDK